LKIKMITIRTNVKGLKLITRTFLAIGLVSGFVSFIRILLGNREISDAELLLWMIPLGIWCLIDPDHTIIKDFRDRGREIREFINSQKKRKEI